MSLDYSPLQLLTGDCSYFFFLSSCNEQPDSIIDFGLSTNRNAVSHSSEMKILVTSYLRVIGNEEATKLQSRAVGKSKTSSSSLNLEGRRNNPRTDEVQGFSFSQFASICCHYT
jgi:hypothetical protein